MHEIALISDIHFGCRSNSEKYLKIIENFFLDTLSNTLREREITDCRILGDLLDNRNSLNIRTMNTVLKIFRWYKNNMPDVTFQILLGNHDIYYHNRTDINSVEMLRGLSNIEIIDSVTHDVINGKKIVMVPWIASKESKIAEDFYTLATGKENYDILMGHFEIRGFEMSPGIEDDHGYDHGVFDKFDRVITGHYHLRSTKGKITYMGCPYQLTWGDYGDQKGIHILKVDTNELEFIPNNDSPVHVRIMISDIAANNKEEIRKVRNNFVKLIIDKKYKDSAIIKVINKLESLEPQRLDVENQYVESLVWDDEAEADLDGLNDPLSFLIEYTKVIDLPDDFEYKKLSQMLSDMYQLSIKEND